MVEYDNDQLRDAISKVLSDEGLRRRFGEEGRRLVRGEFGWGEVVKKWRRFLKKQIDSKIKIAISIVDDISEDKGIIMRAKRLAKLLGEERLKRVTKMEQAYRLAILPIRGVKDD